MRSVRPIISLYAALVLASSCAHDINVNDNGLIPISFTSGIQTRSFLNSEDINVEGSELTVYGFDGTSFIPGVTASYDTDSGWTLDKTYYWNTGRDYSFFAILAKDRYGNTISGIDTSGILSNRKLKVAARTFDFASSDNDFDLSYSGVVNRPRTNPDHSVVNLGMKHLFAAVAFSAHNYTTSTVTLKDVTIFGLKNRKSASVNFPDSGSTVIFDNEQCSWTSGRKLNSSDITIASNSEYANIVGSASLTPQYYMFWPQTSEELAAEGWTDSDTCPEGGSYIKVVYEQSGNEYTKYALFPEDPEGGWPAGTRQMMEIAFSDCMMTLRIQTLDWDYSQPEINYDDNITVTEALEFDSTTCTVDPVNRMVYLKGSTPVKGTFKLSAPIEGTWIISKEGDFDAFEIDNSSLKPNGKPYGIYGDGKDCNYGPLDSSSGNSFTLYPRSVPAGKDYSITLSFSVRFPDGESYCIDDKIQPSGKWTVVLTK